MEWRSYTLYWDNEEHQQDFEEDYEAAVAKGKELALAGHACYLAAYDQDGDERSYEVFGEENE